MCRKHFKKIFHDKYKLTQTLFLKKYFINKADQNVFKFLSESFLVVCNYVFFVLYVDID